jgi:hypothetical protein
MKLEIKKGATWKHVIRWETKPTIFKSISGASKTAPAELSVPSHGLPSGWRILRITGMTGMTQMNTHKLSAGKYRRASLGNSFPNGVRVTVIDSERIQLDDVNATEFGEYTSGGVIEYLTPMNLSAFTAQMHMRASVKSPTTLFELTQANGRILINVPASTITLQITAADTAALTFKSAVASLELSSASGEVTPLLVNTPVIVRETDVTR